MPKYLIDTDVIIDYLRGNHKTKTYFDKIEGNLYLSSITVAELYVGIKEGSERHTLEKFIALFDIITVDVAIAMQGGLYRREYFRRHGTGLADALIAASAHSISATLVTLNKKHFPMLSKIVVPYRKK